MNNFIPLPSLDSVQMILDDTVLLGGDASAPLNVPLQAILNRLEHHKQNGEADPHGLGAAITSAIAALTKVSVGLGNVDNTSDATVIAATIAAMQAQNNLEGSAAASVLASLALSSGASLVGFTQSGTGAVARTVQDKNRESVSVKDFGAVGDGVTDDTAAIQAAINSGASRIYAPSSIYSVSTIDLRGKYVEIIGDGITATIFKCRSATAVMFNASESSDIIFSPLKLTNLAINGSGLAQTNLDIRYRHFTTFTDVLFYNATVQNVKAKDTWLMQWNGGGCTSAPIGIWLVGSNHRSAFRSISFQSCTTWHIKAEQSGTALDGNDALEFDNIDVEYGTGAGIYLDVTSASFRSCYLGENINGTVFQVQAGNIEIYGGAVFYGHTTASILATGNGGKTLFKKVRVNGQTNSGFAYVMSGSASNTIRFEYCSGSTPSGGNQTIVGDVLDYGAQGLVFAPRLGKSYSSAGNNVTVSNGTVANELTATATAAPGPTPLISVYASTILPAQWLSGSPAYLVVTYASSKAVNVYLSTGVFGGNSNIGGLPATSGIKTTYIKLDYNLPTTAYAVLEFILQSVAVSDYLTIYDVTFSDNRMLNKGQYNFGNLYKC